MQPRISSKAMGKNRFNLEKRKYALENNVNKIGIFSHCHKNPTSLMIVVTLSDPLPYQSYGKSSGFESVIRAADSKIQSPDLPESLPPCVPLFPHTRL